MSTNATSSIADLADSRVTDEELNELYAKLAAANMVPLWTQLGELMPDEPAPRARPHVWRWSELYPLAQRAGDLVPVGRGGERRAIALANPGLDGMPFATPTLWAAIQYLGPREVAPEHRHTQNAFRFVLEGEGVWTVVNSDPVAMRRGDLLLTPGWNFHGHQNVTNAPMAWLDGLDIPFVHANDTSFFEYGPDDLTDTSTPEKSRAERLWSHPGLQPVALLGSRPSSPLVAYRWEYTEAALVEQLALEAEGYPSTVEPGHAAVRFSNPTTGGDVLPTIRAEFHRLRPGTATAPHQEVGSSVWQVFTGRGTAVIGGVDHDVARGDVFVVPSWVRFEMRAEDELDLFRFTDAPIVEALYQYRQLTGQGGTA
ncbi:cupin domain-containing protein [Streptomyces mirabilis]|uniref:cupin domain-containing protein n=1 Tax=Streptomyces mirabilis TaxID=68239 RepID=UPI0036A3CE13